MGTVSVCPGCELALPRSDLVALRRTGASAECWQVHGEVVGFELDHLSLLGRFHQLTVDAYGAQHSGEEAPKIGVYYSLVGLHLAIDRGLDGPAVRGLHQRMGKPQPSWPVFARPADLGPVRVLEVAEAGSRAGSVPGHAEAVQRWASSVWRAWSNQHAAVTALTDVLL